jgi:hypothetical protein
MKKIISKILEKALARFLDILLNALERMLQIDIDGDGKIGDDEEKE